jgi:hypothetical protein
MIARFVKFETETLSKKQLFEFELHISSFLQLLPNFILFYLFQQKFFTLLKISFTY